MKSELPRTLLALLLFCTTLPAYALDSLSLELGSSEDVNMAGVGVQWDWNKKWEMGNGWILSGYWDVDLRYWQGDSNVGGDSDLLDLGFTPVFRLSQNKPSGVYMELAVGAHLLSKTEINNSRKFGSAFQFGDHLGIGARFGDHGEYDLSYRLQHLSNASIKQPNDGITFNQVRFAYHF